MAVSELQVLCMQKIKAQAGATEGLSMAEYAAKMDRFVLRPEKA